NSRPSQRQSWTRLRRVMRSSVGWPPASRRASGTSRKPLGSPAPPGRWPPQGLGLNRHSQAFPRSSTYSADRRHVTRRCPEAIAASAQAGERQRLGRVSVSEPQLDRLDATGIELDHVRVTSGDRKSTRLNSSHVKISYA